MRACQRERVRNAVPNPACPTIESEYRYLFTGGVRFPAPWSRVVSSAWLFRPRSRLAAALAEDGSRRSRPGAVPDYCFTVDGRRMLYDVKRIALCPSRYWPTVAVASSRGGPLEHRVSLVRAEYEAAAAALDARTAQPGTFGRGPPPQSGHRRQSISSLRSLQFAAWSLGAPLAGGPGRSASSLPRRRRRQPSVSGARSAPVPCSTRGPS